MLDTELEVIAHLDDFEELRCESVRHDSDPKHSGVAAYWQDGPCEHTTGYRCAPYVETVLRSRLVGWCRACAMKSPNDAFTFTPISNN